LTQAAGGDRASALCHAQAKSRHGNRNRILVLMSIVLRNTHAAALAACLCLGPAVTAAEADEKPLWELGAGATVLVFPDYRGSDQTRTYVLPIPYVVYRGDFFKADRDGVRGIFAESENVKFHASVGASFPVDSSDNDARQGMPDLKPTVELGPAVDVTLWTDATAGLKLTLRLPLRFAFTVERSPEYIGWLFSPRLNLDIKNPGGLSGWNLGLFASPAYGDARLHDYFYSVAPAYATPSRPAYDAPAGYNGMEFLAAVSKRFPQYWVGAFVRYDTLDGAAFVDSPLVRTRGYFAAGVAIAWIFGESSQRVSDRD
jgi:outer membrane scaffolding protein for murein synthesis (MipA/OmpV family)